MDIRLSSELPEYPAFVEGIRRAPGRGFRLSRAQAQQALANALRYVPNELHEVLAPEFMEELTKYGRIYAYRYRPAGRLFGRPVDEYEGKCLEGKAFQVMIDNNLDFEIALYPYELITYGETGAVCQNWLQYRLIMLYLQNLTQDLTLVVQSGHPLGLFPSRPEAPRVIITNGLMIGMFDNLNDFEIAAQMGVANYGQMTAGGWMYIGPQGIVHGTYNTLLNAGRMKLGLGAGSDLAGKLFVSSGLGGMSGAQPKAIEIAGGVGIIAEVDESRIQTRYDQGWVRAICRTPKESFELATSYLAKGEPYSIAYAGNIVDLLEYAAASEIHIDLLTDQTSCHDVYGGGYCPQISFSERTRLLTEDRAYFVALVDETLKKHYAAIEALVARGTYFFDYGNSFLKALYDCGITSISKNGIDEKDGFIYPSYVEDILGPELFDYGYGPFRWICLSGDDDDLRKTDAAAKSCIDPTRREADRDNYAWIDEAEKNRLVVGTKARILYQDAEGRTKIALKFNEMVRNGEVGPIMLGRDHHDTGGTDSPFRETANIKDGSNITADMATQSFAGNAARGMSLIALHNGGGVGIGKSVNGGFGLVLDGSARIDEIIKSAMMWDVNVGIARRSWAKNPNAMATAEEYNQNHAGHITLPFVADETLLEKIVSG
ncbi:MAG: urocanate hydratase [Clostridiales bacterium]|jgi:urocanate hydratase|nr:urocanate hydratase [Clostridiales bacterium]